MFNFTTQNIINSLVKDKNYFYTGDATKFPQLRIGNVRFSINGVNKGTIRWWKQPYTPENLTSVTFDLSKISAATATADDAGTYRFKFYIKLHNSDQSSVYSNALVYKGKPLFLEFTVKVGDTLAGIAKRIKSNAAKYQAFFIQEQLLKVDIVNSTTVKFTGVDGHQMLTEAVLQKYNPNAKVIDCCTNEGDYEDKITGIPRVYTLANNYTVAPAGQGGPKYLDEDGKEVAYVDTINTPIEPGIPAFGDYEYIMSNLRIPTAANTGYWAVTKKELPIVGGTYDQFTIELCKDRDGIAGEVVGQRATSVTTHVFYVLSSLSADFEDLLTEAVGTQAGDTITNGINVAESNTEADTENTVSTVIKTPYKGDNNE